MITFLSGISDYTVALANLLSNRCEMHLFLPKKIAGTVKDAVDSDVALHTFDSPRLRSISNLWKLPAAGRMIRSVNPDVVHLQSGHFWLGLFLRALKRHHFPIVATVHDHRVRKDEGSLLPRTILRKLLAAGDQFIIHSVRFEKELAKTGINADRISVIPHGFVPVFELLDKSGDVPREKDTVLFFGRIEPYKGLDVLVKAVPLVRDRVPDLKVIVAGPGALPPGLDSDTYEVHNRYLPAGEVASFFKRASVVALPYLDATQSGIVPTAFRFGAAVVATAVGGIPDVVRNGETGLLVPPGDEVALADAIVRLLTDDDIRRSVTEGGRRLLKTELLPESIARKTIAVYRKALETKNYS